VLVKEFGKLDDIHGSQPGSKVTGIKLPEGVAKRETNPLAPSYQIPGATEVADFDPFGEKGCSMSKTNYQSRLELQKLQLREKLNA
jgi:hypothetical protein